MQAVFIYEGQLFGHLQSYAQVKERIYKCVFFSRLKYAYLKYRNHAAGSAGLMDGWTLDVRKWGKRSVIEMLSRLATFFLASASSFFFIHLLHSICCHTHYFITLCLVSWSNSTRSLIIPFIYPKLVPSDVILALVVCVLVDSFVCLCISKGPVQTPSLPSNPCFTYRGCKTCFSKFCQTHSFTIWSKAKIVHTISSFR